MEKLSKIQAELKVSKSHYNKFGKYNYRSCEDILEAVKPLLVREKLTMIINDTISQVGDTIFLEAEVALWEGGTVVGLSRASAGHPKEMAGMSLPQITGACSSYARKYALSGMFLLDDAKQVDEEPVKKTELTPEHDLWEGAKKKLGAGGTTIAKIRESFHLTDSNAKLLQS
jgi:hypothetical protein